MAEASEVSLKDNFDRGAQLLGRADTLQGDQRVATLAEAEAHLSAAYGQLRELGVFSANETYHEHSYASLRYLQIPALRAAVASKHMPNRDDPERDLKRIAALQQARDLHGECLQLFAMLGFEFADQEKIDAVLEAKPGQPKNRDEKIAQLRASMEVEKQVESLAARVKEAQEGGKPDDELENEHVRALLHSTFLKSVKELEMLGVELDMLLRMQQQRQSPGGDMRAEPVRPSKPEAPLVVTKDMVQQLVQSGTSINRANFQLVTAGYGPIGAPTMTLDEALEKEMQFAIKAQEEENLQAAHDEDVDSDSDAAADAATYKAREQDEWRDNVRRGDGNRYNQG